MAHKQSAEHPWRGDNRCCITNREFIALKAKNPDNIEPTICPPGNALGCVLGMDKVRATLRGAKINGKNVGRIYIGPA